MRYQIKNRKIYNSTIEVKPISYDSRYFNVAGADKLRTGLVSKHSTHLIKIACEVAVGKRKKLIINGNN